MAATSSSIYVVMTMKLAQHSALMFPYFIPLLLLQRTVHSPLVEGYSQCQVQSKEDGNEIRTII